MNTPTETTRRLNCEVSKSYHNKVKTAAIELDTSMTRLLQDAFDYFIEMKHPEVNDLLRR